MSTPTTFHQRSYMFLCVRGAIRDLQGRRRSKKHTGYTDDQGRPLNRDQAIDALMDELAKGHEVIPMHKGCGNPCRNSNACAGFDYKDGGCPGYPVDAAEASAL
ncbi:hypothetical protein [Chitiniphilus eburneus]|uniref:Uncharacterized protein n=1 Tax=Chitiniphilus eburneus TaxID=2571148 RepID=A0A4U0Q3Q1_9NEIS|nr:hypothetical protein [Chitiniphilus eburneus]TJZ75615.1 hypothetical protein FAZ21_06790 [Chitiniphilus eburneus]